METIILIAVGIFNFILLIKIWGMCNNVKAIRKAVYSESDMLTEEFRIDIQNLYASSDKKTFDEKSRQLAKEYNDKQAHKVIDFRKLLKDAIFHGDKVYFN